MYSIFQNQINVIIEAKKTASNRACTVVKMPIRLNDIIAKINVKM